MRYLVTATEQSLRATRSVREYDFERCDPHKSHFESILEDLDNLGLNFEAMVVLFYDSPNPVEDIASAFSSISQELTQ